MEQAAHRNHPAHCPAAARNSVHACLSGMKLAGLPLPSLRETARNWSWRDKAWVASRMVVMICRWSVAVCSTTYEKFISRSVPSKTAT